MDLYHAHNMQFFMQARPNFLTIIYNQLLNRGFTKDNIKLYAYDDIAISSANFTKDNIKLYAYRSRKCISN